MSPTERDRHELLQQLAQAIGRETAEHLMEHVPPYPWHEGAKQSDLLALRQDMDELRSDVNELRSDVNELRTDVNGLKMDVADIKTEFRIMNATLDLRFDSLRDGLSAQFHSDLLAHSRVMYFSMIGAVFTSASLAFAAVRL